MNRCTGSVKISAHLSWHAVKTFDCLTNAPHPNGFGHSLDMHLPTIYDDVRAILVLVTIVVLVLAPH
jgi:hypothetical protein